MTSHVPWNNIRTEHVDRAGGEAAVAVAVALGGRLHQAIYFDDGDITAIA